MVTYDYTNVLIADIFLGVSALLVWIIWLRKDWISLGIILFYVSMIPLWHYYHYVVSLVVKQWSPIP